MAEKSSDKPKEKIMYMQKSRIKTMLIDFLDLKIVHKEFTPEGGRVNAECYVGVLN